MVSGGKGFFENNNDQYVLEAIKSGSLVNKCLVTDRSTQQGVVSRVMRLTARHRGDWGREGVGWVGWSG